MSCQSEWGCEGLPCFPNHCCDLIVGDVGPPRSLLNDEGRVELSWGFPSGQFVEDWFGVDCSWVSRTVSIDMEQRFPLSRFSEYSDSVSVSVQLEVVEADRLVFPFTILIKEFSDPESRVPGDHDGCSQSNVDAGIAEDVFEECPRERVSEVRPRRPSSLRSFRGEGEEFVRVRGVGPDSECCVEPDNSIRVC